MDEDFQSFIVDPDLVDPGIDVSGLKTQTSTRPELLFDLPEFSGIKVDPTRDRYIRDMYEAYGGGLPMLPVEDTAQIPGAIDTLVDVGGGGGGGSLLDTPTAQIPGAVDTLINVGGEADMGTLPATTPVDNRIQIENISADPYSIGRDIDDPGASIENLAALQTPSSITRDIKPIQDLPMAQEPLDIPTQDVGLAYTGEFDPDDEGTVFDTSGLADATPEQRNTIQNILTAAGDNVQGALTQLGKIPGAIVDFANQTVDVFGKKLNVGKTLASIALNKIAGGPVSLVFDVLSAILPKDTLENRTTRSIVDELKAEKDYGFNMQSGNLNQDPFGRNPVSGFGDYEQTLKNDILGIDQSGFQTAEMTEKKKEFAKDYFNKKAIKAGGFDPNNEGTVLGPGEAPGEVVTLDDLLQEQRDEKIDAGIQAADDDKDSNIDTFDTTPSDQNIIERGGGDDIGTGGLDPNRRQQVDRESSGDKDEVGITVTRDTPKESTYDAEREDDRDVGKIVCTMMNESYGFGSFRNKIWMKFHKDLSPEYQKGYHKLFLPLVRIAKTNKVVKKVLEHIAVHSTIDMRQATRGKTHLLGRVYRKILLPLCYWVGKNG